MDIFEESDMRQKVIDAINEESTGCFPLAKLSVDDIIEAGTFEEVKGERVRLPLHYIRYFSMALHRIKEQTCDADVRLAQAVLSLVASAGVQGSEFAISFNHLKGALAMLDTDQKFGEPLDRARLARVTQGWLCLGERTSNGPFELSLFCGAARTFISDEASNTSDHSASGFKEFMVVCLNAITAPASQQLFLSLDGDPGKARQKLAKWPFIEHALRHWGRYALEGPSVKTRQLIREFLRINFQSAPKLQYLAMLVGDGVRCGSSDRLHIIARYGLTDLIEDCIQADSKIDVACTISGQTAAMVASRFRHLLFLEKLKDHGVDLALYCHDGQTALSIAVDHGSLEMIHSILKHRPKDGTSLINARYKDGTILMRALRNEDPDVIEALLQYNNLDLEQRDEFGRTAFHVAIDMVNLDALRILVRYGGNAIVTVTERNAVGRSPLMGLLRSTSPASVDERLETLSFMAEQGASMEVSDAFGRNLLQYAAVDDRWLPILRMSLEHGADVSSQDARGWTALHTACATGSKAAVKGLIDAGADIHCKDRKGLTPAAVAKMFYHEDIAKSLSKDMQMTQMQGATRHRHGIPTNSCPETELSLDQSLASTLHSGTKLHAVLNYSNNEASVLEVLRECSGDINALDHYGRSPVHVAMARRSNSFSEDEQDMIDRIIAKLLQHPEIDLNIADDRDERVLELALLCSEPLSETSLALMDAGARIADTNLHKRDIDALFRYALVEASPSSKTVAALLEAGANVFLLVDNKTPWQHAVDRGWDEEILNKLSAEENRILNILKNASDE